jgi:hypothetical protein
MLHDSCYLTVSDKIMNRTFEMFLRFKPTESLFGVKFQRTDKT